MIIIEHNLDIIRNADYLLDMGPEGGEFGGTVIGHGTPEQLAGVEGIAYGALSAAALSGSECKERWGQTRGRNRLQSELRRNAVKGPKTKFVPNEKKTGVPTGKPSVAKPVSKKAAAKKTAAKKKATH